MGVMCFQVPRREQLGANAAERAYMAGMEGIPWPSRARWTDQGLEIDREVDDSGNLYVPWNVNGYGEITLCTTSLMQRTRPYALDVELARGTLNRVRNQIALWEPAGLQVTAEVVELVHDAGQHFQRAATGQHDPEQAGTVATQSIHSAVRAIEVLMDLYSHQVLQLRHDRNSQLQTVFASNLLNAPVAADRTQLLADTFNAAVVPLSWAHVEETQGHWKWDLYDQQFDWCLQHGLKAMAGPLVQLAEENLPHWVYLWEDDFENLASYILGFVEAATRRFVGQVTIWNCAARMNTTRALSLSEEQNLNLTVRAVECMRSVDPRTPLIVSFDQPWAEYVARQGQDLTPLYFADWLVRAELGLTGFGLEMNLGYWPRGSSGRDMLEVSQQLDRWGALGLPLVIFLTVPSDRTPDPLAAEGIQPVPGPAAHSPSPATQQQIVRQLIPLLLSKQCVHGIVWNQLDDSQTHIFPHGGLFDSRGEAKPVCETLREIRAEHLV